MGKDKKDITSIPIRAIQKINSPLGFYVLSLLIIETFLTIVLLKVDFDQYYRLIGIFTGVVLFIIVIIIVTLLVWFKPRSLLYDKEAHLNEGKLLNEVKQIEEIKANLSTAKTCILAYDKNKDNKMLLQAEIACHNILKIDHNEETAYIVLGKIKRRQAFDLNIEEKNKLLGEAIKYCKTALKVNPQNDVAFYNMACYKALLGQNFKSPLKDLKEAFSLELANKQLALVDPDLKNVINSEEFKKLIDSTN